MRNRAAQSRRECAAVSVQPERQRDDDMQRQRMLLNMRAGVVRAVWRRFPTAGSAAVEEAVDEALAQLVRAGIHLEESADVAATWIVWSRRRLIDERRSAEFRNRHVVIDIDDAVGGVASDDVTQLTDDDRQWWRIREILDVLHGDQRAWAEAWYDEVLSDTLPAGAQPRGLPAALGWSPSKTKSVSQRARRKMAAFLKDRASGAICADRRALLDSFIDGSLAAEAHDPSSPHAPDRHQAVLLHIAGCEDCWAVWRARRRTLLGRCHSILLVPVDALSAAGHALADRLGAAAAGAHSATQALLARLGLGGAGAAALGGGAATISGKTAAVCAALVCAATAGGEIAGVLPVLHERSPKTRDTSAAKPEKTTPPAPTQTSALRTTAPSTPSPVRSAATLAATSRSGATARTATIQSPATPGDLPIARATRSPSTSTSTRGSAGSPTTSLSTLSTPTASSTSPTRRRAATTAPRGEPDCVPGDLGC
jgi:hypothetical protein